MAELDINHHISKFISSQQMENSETQKRIINLGKALIEKLELNPGVDTLARWMAHYVAEQMTIAENTEGDEKTEAEQHCFETILKLWQHRSSLPNGSRPFENFEPIFKTLEKLNPDKSISSYYSVNTPYSSEQDVSGEAFDNVHHWLKIAQSIDEVARVWLEFAFQQAAQNAKDEKTQTWLENSIDLPDNDEEFILIRQLLESIPSFDEGDEDGNQQTDVEKLNSRIKKLDTFIEFSKSLREEYTSEIDKLKK